MKFRRHHNNKGYSLIKSGKLKEQTKELERKLGIKKDNSEVSVELPVKPACETLAIIDEMLREADILKEHKNYVYSLDNAERLRAYKLALQRLKQKIMSKSV